jgi:mannan endo-1,4-beta-mannosidase
MSATDVREFDSLSQRSIHWSRRWTPVFAAWFCVLIAIDVSLPAVASADAPGAAANGTSTSVTTPAKLTAATAPDPNVPVIESLSPSTVSAGGGATVTITGTGFTGAEAVYFGQNASSQFSVLSPTTITATAPTNKGPVTVSVVTQGNYSSEIPTPATTLNYESTGQLPITAAGTKLEVDAIPLKFTGVNAFELATASGTNAGCGGMETRAQIASLFSSLAPDSIVRFWAFQGTMAIDDTTRAIDWAPIDEVFDLAAQYHVYLIPAITDQGGTCDGGHWQDPAWYAGGYRFVYNDATNSSGTGLEPLSYWTYMEELVRRYRNSPALGMWEPISEPEASTCPAAYQPTSCGGHLTCPDEVAAGKDLRSFFNKVGGEVQLLDPTHLVEAGFLGGAECGISGNGYELVGASPGINVLSVHDYDGPTLVGGDMLRFVQAAALDKPIITGEVGIEAGSGSGCISTRQRSVDMAEKLYAQFAAGSSAFLIWNWFSGPPDPCGFNTGPGDPLMSLLGR